MPEWINQLLERLKGTNSYVLAAFVVGVAWIVWTNKDNLSNLLPMLKGWLGKDKPTPDDLLDDDGVPIIDEITLMRNPRLQVFYYLEQIRYYAEESKNEEAVKDCQSLLVHLFQPMMMLDEPDKYPEVDHA